ncbi:MAG: cyclic nucleotide-binding domain-containing protein [Patescibacteria group bacterium]
MSQKTKIFTVLAAKAELKAITQLPLFEGLDLEKHFELVNKIQIKNFKAGEFIFHEGELGQQLHVIKSGEVEIVRIQDDIAEEVAFLKAGDIFGELGSLGKKTRNASARAFADSEILIIDRDTVLQLSTILPNFDLLVGKRYMERAKANESPVDAPEIKIPEDD